MNKLYIFGGVGILFLLVIGIFFVSGNSSITITNNPITNLLGFNSKVTIENATITKTSKLIYSPPANETINFTWNIQKSGAEENLDINFDIINSTHTEFCIGFEDKASYIDYYNKENKKEKDVEKRKDLKKVPIVKIKDDESKIKFQKTELDLESLASNNQDCFTIEHGKNVTDLSFKIGWNSVLVTTTTISYGIEHVGGKSFIIQDDGTYVIAYLDNGIDFTCAYSTDEGDTWTEVSAAADSFQSANVVTNGTATLFVGHQYVAGDISYYYSASGGCFASASSETDISGMTTGEGAPSLAYDGFYNRYVMCFPDSGQYPAFAYTTNPALNNWTQKTINTGLFNDADYCDLEADDYGNIHMCFVDTGNGNLYHINSSNNFTTYNYSQITTATGNDCDIVLRDNYIAITLTDGGNNLRLFYSNDSGLTMNEYENTSIDFDSAASCISDDGLISTLSSNIQLTPDEIFYSSFYIDNSTFNGYSSINSIVGNDVNNPKISCSNYPTTYKFDNTNLKYIFMDTSSTAIYYNNYAIPFPPTSHTSAILTSSLGTNLTTENLTLSLSGSTDANGDTIHNITDWRVNDSSIAILNIPFDIEESTITDFSTNQFSGVINGNPTYNSTGKVGGAYDFDGTGDYINFTDGTIFNEFNGEFSIETWVNIDNFAVSGQNYIFSTCNVFNIGGFCLQVGDDHNYKFTVTNSSIHVYPLYSPAIQDSWQHVVGTYNGTDIKIYINGTLMNSSYFPSVSGNSNNGYATIGADYLGQQYFDGQISDLKIYNHSLSEEQILYNYNQGLSGKNIDKILSQETSIGQNWTANITTTDLFDYGGSSLSNYLLIVAGAGADTCTYTSGNWEVDCSDNCVISSPVDVAGNNISIIGTGTFITQSAITNFEELLIKGTDSSNICEVICDGGCFEGAT